MTSLRADLGAARDGRRRVRSRPIAAATAALALVTACASDGSDDSGGADAGAPDASGTGEPTTSAAPDEPEEWVTGDVAIFLCIEPTCGRAVTDDELEQLRNDLLSHPAVDDVVHETQERSFARFLEEFGDDPALTHTVTAEDLPAALRVLLDDAGEVATIVATFEDRPGVDQIVVQPPHDVAVDRSAAGLTPDVLARTAPATRTTTPDLNDLDRGHLAAGLVRSAGAFRAA